MSEDFWLKIVDSLPGILTALGLFIASIIGTVINFLNFARTKMVDRKTDKALVLGTASVAASKVNAKKIDAVHNDVNGKMQELIDTKEAKGHAEGSTQGYAQAVKDASHNTQSPVDADGEAVTQQQTVIEQTVIEQTVIEKKGE